MGLEFLNPAFLWGTSLAGIPILIHLLQRRRFRVVRWGAMEFLRLSVRSRSRRLKLEQVVLLLIRCLVLLFLALALARPVLRPTEHGMTTLLAMAAILLCLLGLAACVSLAWGADPVVRRRCTTVGSVIVAIGATATYGLVESHTASLLLRADARVHAIVVLDNSFSMGYRPAGREESLFEQARARALDLVQRGLRNGDSVSLILAADPPRAVIARPSVDLDAVAAEIRAATLSAAPTHFGKVARLCLELASHSPHPNREVYLITDCQAYGWQSEGVALEAEAWNALRQQARLTLLAVRDPNAQNLAVAEVRTVGGVVTVGRQARFRVRLANHTSRTATVNLLLEVDGKPAESVQAEVPTRGEATALLTHRFERAGPHAVVARIPTDRLDRDDVGYLSVPVQSRVRVLVLNGRSDPLSSRDAAAFLVAAMDPLADSPGAEPTPLEPNVITGTTFGGRDLGEYDLVVLCNVARLGEEDRTALATFVQAGGGVWIFPGDRVDPATYNRELAEGRPGLLPARLGAPVGSPQEPIFLDPASAEHSALARFRGAADVDLHTAGFTRYFPLEVPAGDRSVQVMLRFTNGAPYLVERQLGRGRIVLAASGANTEWNDLPLKPAWLPLVQELASYLARGGEHALNVRVGEPLLHSLPLSAATRPVEVTGPDDRRESLRPVVDERGCTVTYRRTDRPGFYRLAAAEGEPATFAVNVDPRESNLASLDGRALQALLPQAQWLWVEPHEDILAAIRRARLGIELWQHLLYFALVLMVAETALAPLFGRRA